MYIPPLSNSSAHHHHLINYRYLGSSKEVMAAHEAGINMSLSALCHNCYQFWSGLSPPTPTLLYAIIFIYILNACGGLCLTYFLPFCLSFNLTQWHQKLSETSRNFPHLP